MNEFSAWFQDNWYSLGSLLAQVSFLFAGVWFARRILRSLRATQQQFGALLKFSMTDGLEEHRPGGTAPHRGVVSVAEDRPTPYVMAEWPTVKQAPLPSDDLRGPAKASISTTEAQETTPYVAAPLTLPEEAHNGWRLAAAGRDVVRWLQTPMRTHQATPWRRMVRWLQAPARG